MYIIRNNAEKDSKNTQKAAFPEENREICKSKENKERRNVKKTLENRR